MTPTCDLYDQHKDAARIPHAGLRDFGGRRAFSGVAVTVKCFEDNSRIKELAGTDGRGKVMVVSGGGSPTCALMGDMIAAEAVKQGWEGGVIDGWVRDVAGLARRGRHRGPWRPGNRATEAPTPYRWRP